MRRLITCIFIILIPFAAFPQEEEPGKQPETFFNELVRSLSADSTRDTTSDMAAEPSDTLSSAAPEDPAADTTALTNAKTEKDSSLEVTESPGEDMKTATAIDDTSSRSEEAITEKPQPSETAKKEKTEKVKKRESEPREFAPYIEDPDPRTRSQKKYVNKMEKAPNRNMRLITLDQADIIHSRKFRSVDAALANPANLGTRSEFYNSFSIIPVNTLSLDINTSTRPFVLLNEYFTTGELLTEAAEDSLISMLGPNGLEIPVGLELPTLFNL
ncbi:MAG: hypothetical protein U5N26_08245 [Candidatus Marinimicrobia bacterium]|nr:hypothetical protein [Candidatus Neomarinimicrobiota bacterium]